MSATASKSEPACSPPAAVVGGDPASKAADLARAPDPNGVVLVHAPDSRCIRASP